MSASLTLSWSRALCAFIRHTVIVVRLQRTPTRYIVTARARAQLPPDQGALAWVQYMRWARRADGLAASRKLFIRSRKWPACGWQARAAPAARAATYAGPCTHAGAPACRAGAPAAVQRACESLHAERPAGSELSAGPRDPASDPRRRAVRRGGAGGAADGAPQAGRCAAHAPSRNPACRCPRRRR
jgi:hypothetical protein